MIGSVSISILLFCLGAIILNFFAKRKKMQVEFAKVSFGICCLSTVLLMMALNTYDHLWWIALAFGGFGFFGYAAYPMSLELAVEESFPIDASISEVTEQSEHSKCINF